jgi:hypothetical protein
VNSLSAVLRFYKPLLKNKYDDVQRRGRDLEHLQTIAKRYKTPAKLLDDIALDPTEAVQENTPRRSSRFCDALDRAFSEGARVGQLVCDLDD